MDRPLKQLMTVKGVSEQKATKFLAEGKHETTRQAKLKTDK